jgi:hypothetical protein
MKTPKDTHLLATIRASLYAQQQCVQAEGPSSVRPSEFVTISRQAGAGGQTLASRLPERLNAEAPSERPWSVWDRELVEQAAHEHHLPEALMSHVESHHRSAFAFTIVLNTATAEQHSSIASCPSWVTQRLHRVTRSGIPKPCNCAARNPRYVLTRKGGEVNGAKQTFA